MGGARDEDRRFDLGSQARRERPRKGGLQGVWGRQPQARWSAIEVVERGATEVVRWHGRVLHAASCNAPTNDWCAVFVDQAQEVVALAIDHDQPFLCRRQRAFAVVDAQPGALDVNGRRAGGHAADAEAPLAERDVRNG
jgi:hypothetical protein